MSVFIFSFRNYAELLQFPFLAACDLLFFLAPQLYYIARHPETYEPFGQDGFALFLMLCTMFYLAALAGYRREAVGFHIPLWDFDPNKLIAGLWVLAAISLYGKIKLAGLSEELTSSTQWTGLPVRYLFFKSVGTLCLPLGIVLYFRYRNRLILVPLISELVSILTVIIQSGKRSPAAFLGLMGLTGLWFARRFKFPLWMILVGGVVFTMFVVNIGTYRYLVKSRDDVGWRDVISEVFDIEKTVARFTARGQENETSHNDALNGVVTVGAVAGSHRYDYGMVLWNRIIHRWIPGQLVGHGLKKALQLDVASPLDTAEQECGYNAGVGSCLPGYSEMFASFGFLGVVFMYWMGKIARMVWEQAMTGNLLAQIAHFAAVPIYLRFGGGGIWDLLSGLGVWVLFVLPILIFAKRSPSFAYMDPFKFPEEDVQ